LRCPTPADPEASLRRAHALLDFTIREAGRVLSWSRRHDHERTGESMKTMPAGEFKARCLRVMEEVKKYRTPVVITKKGRPVAKLVPPDEPATDVFGCLAGSARIVGDIETPVLAAQTWRAVGGKSVARRAKRVGARRAPR
ncbi:MAG: prevent-host-death family protein, partial [Candidatus Rokubacteria bacterium]|nr:prevent-host-death family protein [Candidatus Rokubacteria bacterium]